MKLPIIITSLVLLQVIAYSQTSTPTYKVRVKKVENINGVEKITDTTYTSSTPPQNIEIDTKGVSETKTLKSGAVYLDEEITNDGNKTVHTIIMNDSPEGKMDDMVIELKDKMSAADLEKMQGQKLDVLSNNMITLSSTGDSMVGKTIIIKKTGCGASKEDIANAPVETIITIVRRANISELTADDKKRLSGKPTFQSDNKLFTEEMKFSPNPNNGKFNLSFSLSGIGDTQVQILNSEGLAIYNEQLASFTGRYSKDIDISSQAKGIYYVRISQGVHSQLKKIVLD